MTLIKLQRKAQKVRYEVLESVERAGKGHLGGTFSCIEILVVLYYGGVLRIDVNNPALGGRDRFILSKGHACLAIYSIFRDLGVISNQDFQSYGKDGGLGGQLDINMPGVDFNTGSLGHSIGVAVGMAISAKKNKQNCKVFTLIGDSELYEGSLWEAIIFASEQKLNNLICVIDRNRLMVTDVIDEGGVYLNFKEKIESFGWSYIEVDGHDLDKLAVVFKIARIANKPTMILANTIKGKGVSFMENDLIWHHRVPSKEQFILAKKEITSDFK